MVSFASELAAQATGVLTGTVRDDQWRPVINAEIWVQPSTSAAFGDDGTRRTRTDSSGQFRLSGLPFRGYDVHARAIGLVPYATRVTIAHDGPTRIIAVLRRNAAFLDTMVITANTKCDPFTIQGFTCRRHTGKGQYFDFLQIAEKGPEQIGDIFRDVDGFRVRVTHSPRSSYSRFQDQVPREESTVGLRCIRYLVNGKPLSVSPRPLPEEVSEIAAIEIYKSDRLIPLYYMHYSTRCALVVYWTWDGIRSRR